MSIVELECGCTGTLVCCQHGPWAENLPLSLLECLVSHVTSIQLRMTKVCDDHPLPGWYQRMDGNVVLADYRRDLYTFFPLLRFLVETAELAGIPLPSSIEFWARSSRRETGIPLLSD